MPLFCQHIIFRIMKKLVLITLLTGIVAFGYAQQINQASWQQQVDYLIDVSLNDETHTLQGEIAITYTNNSPDDLTEMYIHLWPNGYANNETAFGKQMEENGEMDFFYAKEKERGSINGLKFTSNGGEISWQNAVIDGKEHIDIAKLKLNSPLKSGEKRTIFTPFTVKLPKVFSRLGHEGQDYFITQWYPKPAVYDVNGWNPMPYLNMGEFYSEFGSFKVNVTVPKNYTVVATGECQNNEELGDKKTVTSDTVEASSSVFKTVRFVADDVHDFAWFASKRWGYDTKKLMVNGDEITLRVVGAEPDENDLKHIETAITYYSENVGPYPYSHATVVHGELKAGGGMEYPMITLCDFMSEEVIVHEVGHNWFYGILANNERTYPWMDESINSYYEGQAMGAGTEDKPDLNSGIMMALVKDNLLRSEHQAIATSSEELTNGNYGMSVYGVGARAFGYLNEYLGDALFKKCMTTYYDQWKFKHPLPGDMKQSFEQTSGKNLGWFFDELLYSDTKMDYAVCKHKKGFELKNKGSIAAPVPIDFVRNGVKSTEWFTVDSNQSLIIEDTSRTREASIDSRNKTLDLHQGNNNTASKIKFKFGTGLDKAEYKEVYVVPTFGWNYYDRAMLGLGIHNYSVSNKPLQYHLLPMYSFEKKTVNGEAAINYTKPLKGAAEFLEIGAKARKYSFNSVSVANGDYGFFKISPYLEYHLPKKTHRSSISKTLSLRYDYIGLTPNFDINRGDTVFIVQNQLEKSRQFVTAEYKLENKRNINGYSWQAQAQYGSVATNTVLADLNNPTPLDTTGRRFFPYRKDSLSSENLLRISSVFTYDLDIGLKNKPLQFRVYGSYIFASPSVPIYKNTVGSLDKASYNDYAMEDYLLHRNPEQGLFQNQISNRREFSKFVGVIAQNESWMVTANISVPLPGKIPLRPYIDVLMYDDIKKESWNTSEASIAMSIGIEVEIIKDRFEIFFNLAQSNDITEYQENILGGNEINSFTERITFVLDLNGLMPTRLKRSLKLF